MTEIKTNGISFCGLLTILLIGLKLTNYITWGWWMVLSPIWIPFALIFGVWFGIMIILLILGVIIMLFESDFAQDIVDKIKGGLKWR